MAQLENKEIKVRDEARVELLIGINNIKHLGLRDRHKRKK